MIDREKLELIVRKALENSDCFPVQISVTPDNVVTVEIDSMGVVDIDQCIALTRAIEAEFDRDVEDYELEVGSSGLTTPFKDPRQYLKNVGNDVEILTKDGRKFVAKLTAADNDGFTVEREVKVKREGVKKPVLECQSERLGYDAVKSVRYNLEF